MLKTMQNKQNTLPAILVDRAERSPKKDALLRKEFGIWRTVSWCDYLDNSKRFSLGMIELGLQKNDKVIFISHNRPEWLYTEMGVMCAHGIPLGMYAESEEIEDFQKLISWADAVYIVAEDQEQVDKVLKIADRLPCLKKIIVFEYHEVRRYKNEMLIAFEDVQRLGEDLDNKQPELFLDNIEKLVPEQIAIMATTSGTSGALPKLVMLSHQNLISMATAVNSRDSMGPEDRMMSANPPAWIGERAFSLCWGPLTGFCTCFAETVKTRSQDFREVGASALFSGPRGWDDMISRILVRMEDAWLLKKAVYKIFMPVGIKVVERKLAGETVPFHLFILNLLGEQLLFKHLRNLLGLSKMRNAYTGGGFLGMDQFIFFHAMGVKLRQIYGGTEASGVAVTQLAGDIKANTVGKALSGIEVKVDEDGEILLKGHNIMLGYYKNEEATAETVKDGWLYTGDFGYIEEATGNLVMIDRKKDIMTTNDNHKFSPQDIESKLKFSPYIKEACCFGDKREYVAALIQIDMDNTGKWAEQHHIAYTTFKDLADRKEITQLITGEVRKAMRNVPENLKVRTFSLFKKELDPEDGEITHTRKIRRPVINKLYKEQINSLYDRTLKCEDEVITIKSKS